MNASRRAVLVIAGVLLVVSLLFPPWERTFRGTGRVTSNGRLDELFTTTTIFDGYGFIGRSGSGLRLDSARLIGQCAVIGIVAAIAFACLADRTGRTQGASHGTGDERRT